MSICRSIDKLFHFPSRTLMASLAFCFLSLHHLQAQKTFLAKDNDVDRSPNLSIGGTIFGIDLYGPNLAVFIEGKLTYRFKKERAWIRGHYTIAFGDRARAVTESSSAQEALPADGTQALRNIGGSVGYNFIKKTDYQVAKATFFGNSARKEIKLPLKSFRLYGLHAGYEQFRSILASESTMNYTGTVVENSLKDSILVSGNATPMFHETIISFGIHKQRIEHYVVQVNYGGELSYYTNKTSQLWYADFLFGMNMQLEDLLIPLNGNAPNSNPKNPGNINDPYNFYRVDINKSYKKIPIGGRVGFETITLKHAGLMVGGELGFRPGIMDPTFNFYLLMRIGLMLNFKAK
jgi:hypothetical protein